MRTWLKYAVLTFFAFFAVAGLAYHFGLRNWCLRWGTTPTEVQAALPVDDLFPVYAGQATHAISIHATPERIWPWLMQIGQDRSGFYSYTFLENLIGCDMPKIEHLVPEWKPRALGETVWFATPKRFGGQGRMIAAEVQPLQAFVMVTPKDWESLQAGGVAREGLWSFTIEPSGTGETRLIARIRGGTPPTMTARVVGRLFWEPMHFVMEQRMLRKIRDLSEHS